MNYKIYWENKPRMLFQNVEWLHLFCLWDTLKRWHQVDTGIMVIQAAISNYSIPAVTHHYL